MSVRHMFFERSLAQLNVKVSEKEGVLLLYDPEDARDVPTTWREYLRQSKPEMFGAIVWAWRDFKTAEALRWYRWRRCRDNCDHLFGGASTDAQDSPRWDRQA